ncbi:aldehyde dehydrogenase family protein [Novosphingobium sp. B 225]|uniref:aldehyde dehydrogenase family protein n=1 Tax=Novosphingobium sp. B 225 TaxID=1961849 RepID=UPI000B4ADF10|nr:aldehyde dehydrogenase family protein [Novosphingobium sp. B 225]
MSDSLLSYIAGQWVLPGDNGVHEAVNPATEQVCARVALCGPAEADAAVRAAREAFEGWRTTPLDARMALVERLIAVFQRRYDAMVSAISTEMGAPHDLSHNSQAECGPGHLTETLRAARAMEWERPIGTGALLVHEPVGVCVLITPWNWPINQLAAKIGPALVAGCTMVVKPSEMAPLSAQLFAEFVDEAGFPAGVFNLVHGTGASVGPTLTAHPEVDMISFTGSTAAGIIVSKSAADTVKRVSLELGGKSPNLVFDDDALEAAVTRGVLHCFNNTGQSCNAPTRMLVEASAYARAVEIAGRVGAAAVLGDPARPGAHLGPVSSKAQFDKIQRLIQAGIDEGAQLVCGGPGRADGFDRGYYVRPTIFAGVHNDMTVAREEIFGPVLVMIPFADEAEAVRIANDTPYGLAAYVQSQDMDRARRIARQIRAGSVHLNGTGQDYCSPFGGFKQSGNGREWGEWGLHDFVELKVINGYGAA